MEGTCYYYFFPGEGGGEGGWWKGDLKVGGRYDIIFRNLLKSLKSLTFLSKLPAI